MSRDLLPSNATPLERVLADLIAEITTIEIPIRTLWSALEVPDGLLGYLAWALSVDVWDANWAVDHRRAVVAKSAEVHRLKGTVQSVRSALSAAGYGDAEVIERFGWEFYDGAATHDGAITYTAPDHWAEYRVRLARPITTEQAAQVRKILRNVAPVRCHLKALDFTEALNIYNARISHDGQFTHGVA